MSSTPVAQRNVAATSTLGIRLTPGAPVARQPRSPKRSRSLYEGGLSLRRIIGTTVTHPTSFDSLPDKPVFAYTAGASAVVVTLEYKPETTIKEDAARDDDHKWTQRFYRARPMVTALNSSSFFPGGTATPTGSTVEGKSRTLPRESMQYGSLGLTAGYDASDSPSTKTWTSRERIKAATCLSLSSDGRLLAVGETGYSPRVLVFATRDSPLDTPLTILSEHTFGVKAVAFSADQKYLASLGMPTDGFLYVWALNERTGAARLQFSNRCTSAVKQMIWLNNSIVTVGTRHIKLWKVDGGRNVSPTKQRFALDGTPQAQPSTPKLRALSGRNCLLGNLVDTSFTCAVAIGESQAIVCSDRGDICMLENLEQPHLTKLTSIGQKIVCVAFDKARRSVWLGLADGQTTYFALSGLDDFGPDTLQSLPVHAHTRLGQGRVCAMGCAYRHLITIDSKHSIIIHDLDSSDHSGKGDVVPFPAHGDSVLGVQRLVSCDTYDAHFATWSANGIIMFWNLSGENKAFFTINLHRDVGDESMPNQCQVVKIARQQDFLISGDRFGNIQILRTADAGRIFDTRAHHSEIQGMALLETEHQTLLATGGRDKTVQLYARNDTSAWTLLQTLNEHSAGVSALLFSDDGQQLVSCSSDRTIHIRSLVRKMPDDGHIIGVVPARIITLKTSPVSMTFSSIHSDTLMVSSLDRSVCSFEMSTGRAGATFRATDSDGVDAVVLDALVMGAVPLTLGKTTILAGVSSTDKSVRVYDANSGAYLDREWGHTAGVTDVALLEDASTEQKHLVSTGHDGTIMIWALQPGAQDVMDGMDGYDSGREWSPLKENVPPRPPLRRVLSKAEMADLQRASPVTTPSGRTSPPRTIRKRPSRYALATQSPSLAAPISTVQATAGLSKNGLGALEDAASRRTSPRNRSRSPPSPRRSRLSRRPSVPLLDARSRNKNSNAMADFGSLGMATEQVCRTLRAYRKRLISTDSVTGESLRELNEELRLTVIALGERKNMHSKAISESVLTGLLDEYSDRLVSIFDEKLRLTRQDSDASVELAGERSPNPVNV